MTENLLFTNARVLDPEAGILRDSHAVLVKDGRIAAVGTGIGALASGVISSMLTTERAGLRLAVIVILLRFVRQPFALLRPAQFPKTAPYQRPAGHETAKAGGL